MEPAVHPTAVNSAAMLVLMADVCLEERIRRVYARESDAKDEVSAIPSDSQYLCDFQFNLPVSIQMGTYPFRKILQEIFKRILV